MQTVWTAVRLNYPLYVYDAVLVVAAVWLVAVPRRRTRAAVWTAFALMGKGLTRSLGVVPVGAGWNIHPLYFTGLQVTDVAFTVLIFAAVLVDRRQEPTDG